MNSQEIIDLEQEFVLGVYGRAPFVLERGEGSTVAACGFNAEVRWVFIKVS